jgi:hypothetical protein
MIDAGLPPQLALLEARDLLGPGTNTTSTTLAHILWGLAHDTRFQDGIVGDLESAGWPGDLSVLEKLPRLKVAIKEGIRWTAAACAMLPGTVPILTNLPLLCQPHLAERCERLRWHDRPNESEST